MAGKQNHHWFIYSKDFYLPAIIDTFAFAIILAIFLVFRFSAFILFATFSFDLSFVATTAFVKTTAFASATLITIAKAFV